MGEECPGGRLVFQTTLAAGPIALGKGRSRSGWPEQLTPRNCGQSEHSPHAANAKKPIPNRPVVFMMPPNRCVSAAQSRRFPIVDPWDDPSVWFYSVVFAREGLRRAGT